MNLVLSLSSYGSCYLSIYLSVVIDLIFFFLIPCLGHFPFSIYISVYPLIDRTVCFKIHLLIFLFLSIYLRSISICLSFLLFLFFFFFLLSIFLSFSQFFVCIHCIIGSCGLVTIIFSFTLCSYVFVLHIFLFHICLYFV